MVRFQKLARNLFLTLHGHNLHRQQQVQVSHALIIILQFVHPGSHDTHPHGNQIHPRLGVAHRKPFPAATPSWKLAPRPRSKHENLYNKTKII